MLPMWMYNALSLLCVSLGVLLLTLALLWGLGIVVAQLLRQLGAWPAFVKFVRAYRGDVRRALEDYNYVQRRLDDALKHIDTLYRGYVHILPKLHAIDFSNVTSVEVIVGDQDHGPLIDLIMHKILPTPAYTPYLRLRAAARASKLPACVVVRISQEYYQKYGASIPEVVSAWAELQVSMRRLRPARSTLFLVIEEEAEKNS